MTLASPPHQLTAEDVLDLPNNNSMEFLNGKIVEKPESLLSSRVASRINTILDRFVMNNPVAVVCGSDLGYQCFQMLPGDRDLMRKPDVSVIRIERIRQLPDSNPGYMPIHPDLAVEVLSTNDRMDQILKKLREYRVAGFPLVWVVEPVERTVTIHTNPGKPVILSAEDTIDAPNALPGFSCKVANLFPAE